MAQSPPTGSHVSSPDPYREHTEQRDLFIFEVATSPNEKMILHNQSDLKSVQDLSSVSNNGPLSSDILHENFMRQDVSELEAVTSPDRSLSSPILHPLPSSRASSSTSDLQNLEQEKPQKSEIIASLKLPLNPSPLPDSGVSSSRPDLLHSEQESLSKSEVAALPSPCPTPSFASSRASSSKPSLERLKQESLPEPEAIVSTIVHPALPSLPSSQASSLELSREHEGPSEPEAEVSPRFDSNSLSLSSKHTSSPNLDLEHLEQESLSKSKATALSNRNPAFSSQPSARTLSIDYNNERFDPDGQPLPEAQEPFRPSTLSSLPDNQISLSEPHHERSEQGDISKSDAIAPFNSPLNLPADFISSPVSKVSLSRPDDEVLFPDHSQMLLEQPEIRLKPKTAASPDPQSNLRLDDFESAEDLPSLPSSQVLSSNPAHEPYEPFKQLKISSTSEIAISRDSQSNLDFNPDPEPPQDLLSSSGSRASSLDPFHDRHKEQEILCTSEAVLSGSPYSNLDIHSILDPVQTFHPVLGRPASASGFNYERLKEETSFTSDIVEAVYEPQADKAIKAEERDSSSAAFNTTPDINQATHDLPSENVSSDLKTTKSPFSNDSPCRQRLDTITEHGQEELPSDARILIMSKAGTLDGGLESGRRPSTPQRSSRQRVRSLPDADSTTKSLISTDYLIARLSWPPVDEETDSVDLERSRSRRADSSSNNRSPNNLTPAIGSGRQRDSESRSASGTSVGSVESINVLLRTPDQIRCASGMSQRSSGTPPLRRSGRSVSGDLRLASKRSEAKNLAKTTLADPEPTIPVFPSSSTYDPARDKGKSRASDMADVYVSHHKPINAFSKSYAYLTISQEGWGDVRGGSPLSPTRPPSMRRRQSMQVLELETKLDQLMSENRLLQDAKFRAERTLENAEHGRNQENTAFAESIRTRDLYLSQKDSELNELKKVIEGLQDQVVRFTAANEELVAARSDWKGQQSQEYSQLETEYAKIHQRWQQSTKERDELREQHKQLSTGMEDIVRHEISVAVEEKNLELRNLRDELEGAKEQVRTLQQQILASKKSDDLILDRDEDYFDNQCQKLCGHVQQWVLRFSKFSDGRACFLASKVGSEKVVDRFENAILDGSDVDAYLQDRIKRRDVFMSVAMTMVWEYIFTRYLFGMDREQRQKLKSLEKTLSEVGPASAVHKWRATTLNLLAKRKSFLTQRAQDTEAVVHEIYQTLAAFLPPPSHLVNQIQDSLRNVMSAAVDLSIEMRTQRAEYVMLPPLQPEYDSNGDLARKVYFNASLMNERSGMTSSNEALEAQQAVVRLVLFPLVVKKGDDSGVGDEEIVVCPAQVLTAPGTKDKKVVRIASADESRSAISFGGSDIGTRGNMT